MIFEHSETPIADPRIKVSYLCFKFKKYRYVRENDILYLYGENPEPEELFSKVIIDSYTILLQLIALHSNLEISDSINPFRFGVKEINDSISEHDLNCILKFVKKYGFPYFNELADYNIFFNVIPRKNINTDKTENNILYDVAPLYEHGKFNVSLFVYILHQIIGKDFLRIVARNEFDNYFCEILRDREKKNILLFRKNMKGNDLRLQSPNFNTFITRWNDEILSLEIETENIMHLSSYYLCIMASAGDIGGYIRTCKGCGMLFVTDNPRLQYCQNPCTRQNVHMKKIRQKSKSLDK